MAASDGRWKVLALGGAILVLAVLLTLAVIASVRPAASYPADSPEAAFQAYYTAWQEGDLPTAHGLLADRVRDQVRIDEYRLMDRDWGWARDQQRRLTLVDTRVSGETATLRLRVEEFYSGGLFGGSTRTWTTSVPLVRERGAWHVDQLLVGIEAVPAQLSR